jgi:hypothetical protein
MASVFASRTGYKASTVLASQAVMKYLIINSDGNVAIQTKNYPHPGDPDGVTEEVRLYCEKCKASKVMEFSVMFDEARLIAELGWVKNHKHADGKAIVVVQDDSPGLPDGERKLKVVQ